MKMNKLMIALTMLGLAVPSMAQENQTVSTDKVVVEVTEEVAGKPSDADVSQVSEEVDTADVVEQKMADYVRKVKSSLVKQGKQHSVFVYSGSAEIAINRNDPRWTEFRTTALDKAVLETQKNYLKTLNTEVENNMLYSRTSQAGLPTPTKEDFMNETKMASFLDKVVAVLEGKLDAELEEMGIDPKEFQAAPPSIKRDLFKESVVKEVVRVSYGDLAGMMVIKVYEEIRDSGQGTVGVVMALSAEKRDQVRAMVESKGQVSPNKAKANAKFTSVYEMLYNQNDSLYLKVGTQIIYDNEGYPMLVSYGQAGVTYAQSAQRRKLERQTAKTFADNNAWASLAQTYNLSGDFRSSTSEENQVSETEQFDLMAEGVRNKSSGITNNLIKKVSESAAMTSSVQGMTGVSVEYEWRRKHPVIGHEMVGSVLVWHPKTIQSAVNMASGKTAYELNTDADMSLDGPAGSVNSAESEDMFDAADF
ncbi:hypothetical protein VSVS12_02700 [Vibrio scophthalmi]|uniref:DUF6844 domain-containing protein n=1 Tax=Vibrio scophthalmi TaxID=45658 RepID=UPI00080961C9|nr:hypothetical protein [Vibrio scophthalmi]ANS86449.1 hypothetical protein VSVS12_02700 [Vibrio scophthalmi]